MPRIEDLVRSAFGDLPEDPGARDRALIRLRAEIAETGPAIIPSSRSKAAPWKVVPLGLAIIALVCSALLATGGSSPAAAAGLTRLASVNAAAPATRSVTIDEQRSITQTHLGQGVFTLMVRSTIERSLGPDGAITQTETFRDVQFASDEDRSTWLALGSPDIPQVGERITERLSPSDQDWFDPAQVSTNPQTLLRKLESGKVAPQWQGPSGIFDLIGALLADPRLEAGQRAALFQVAASLEGIGVDGPATDPLGRQGEAYSLVRDGRKQTLIFDPGTGRPLAALDQAIGDAVPAVGASIAFEYPG